MSQPIRGVQITVRSSNVPEVEQRALAILDSQGVKVYGSRSYGPVVERVVLIAVDNGPKAHLALESASLDCSNLTSVLLVPSGGVLPKYELIAQLTRAGVGVLYSYSLMPRESESYLVIKSRDDEEALKLLSTECAARAA